MYQNVNFIFANRLLRCAWNKAKRKQDRLEILEFQAHRVQCVKMINYLVNFKDSESSMSISNFDSTQITPAPPTTPKSIQRKSFTPSSANVPSSPIGNPSVTPTNPAPLPSPKEPNKSRPPKPGFRYMKRSKRIALSDQNSLSMESFELEAPVQDKVTTSVQSNPAASFPMPSRPPLSTTKSTPPNPSPTVDFNSKGNTHEPTSTERMQSASVRPSRVSSRSSFVSEDLDKYMSNVRPIQPPPTVPPRTTPTRQIITRAFSGKSLDTSLQQDQYETQPPPVVKVCQQDYFTAIFQLFFLYMTWIAKKNIVKRQFIHIRPRIGSWRFVFSET